MLARYHRKPLDGDFTTRRASGKTVLIFGNILPVVQIGTRIEKGDILGSRQLASEVIQWCNLCDRHDESIWPGRPIVEMHNVSTVPIARKTFGRQFEISIVYFEEPTTIKRFTTWPSSMGLGHKRTQRLNSGRKVPELIVKKQMCLVASRIADHHMMSSVTIHPRYSSPTLDRHRSG